MNSLVLQSANLRCELNPALGGCVSGLWFGPQPVLHSTPAAQLASVRDSASFPMLPYSNRVGYRKLHWEGQFYVLPENFAPEPHSIHGVAWERPWNVASASSNEAVLSYQHTTDGAWPFAFDAEQRFVLGDNTLDMHLSITNRAMVAAPAGMGWHPYFAKSAQTHVQFAAQGRWEMGADNLPTHRLDHTGLDTDCSSLTIDHCFDGWDNSVVLTEAGLRMQVTSDLGCLVVFTTPARDNLAIEPVSHVNNALALAAAGGSAEALGVKVLQPGETWSASMRIAVEKQA
jgi:aldose 1-epimerase